MRLLLVPALVLLAAAEPKSAELVSVHKIWDAGKHNAFTDLIRWNDAWYCTFREGDAHVGGEGKIRVLTSADGTAWKSAALLAEAGIDLRDPKLSVTPDGRLMIVAGGSVYEGKTLLGRQPRVAFSKDGTTWTPTARVLSDGEWLWRVTWQKGTAYGLSYNAQARSTQEAREAARSGKVLPGPAEWKLKLVTAADGKSFGVVKHLDVPGHPNESTLRFLPDGDALAIIRREGGDTHAWLGRAKAPYTDWTFRPLGDRLGGPNFVRLPDGRLIVVARRYDPKVRTSVGLLDSGAGTLTELLTLPSGGDTSYAGLVWHEGLLWVSYYSSHEGKTSIYLAKVRFAGG